MLDFSHRREFLQKELEQFNIVTTSDSAGIIVYVNDKYCEVSKYSREELIGKHNRMLDSDIHPKEFFVELRQTVENGHSWRGEVCKRAKDGSIFGEDSFVIPEMDENGKLIYTHAFKVIITKQKK